MSKDKNKKIIIKKKKKLKSIWINLLTSQLGVSKKIEKLIKSRKPKNKTEP